MPKTRFHLTTSSSLLSNEIMKSGASYKLVKALHF